MKNNRGSLTIIAIFTVLLFSLYGVLLYARSASAYIRQSKAIETIQKAYAQDVPNAVQIAKQLGATSTYIGEYCTVTFNANNGTESTSVNVIPGELVSIPNDPVNSGYVFDGWYYMQESGTEENPIYTEYAYNFSSPATSDITIYAKYKGEAVMMARNNNKAFWQSTYRTKITNIEFKKSDFSTIPTEISDDKKWEIQADEKCAKIIAYLENDGAEGYKLTVLSPNTIYANANSGIYFYNFTNLQSITLNNFDTSKVINMYAMFRTCSNLTILDLESFHTENVTDMSYMFRDCSSLTELNLSSFNTRSVTNMSSMFTRCSNLSNIELRHFDTSKVTNMNYMFLDCNGLTGLDLSGFNTANVTSMRQMFGYCKSVTSLNVSSFVTSKVTDMAYLFYGCSELERLDISNFDTSNVTDMTVMFFNCIKLSSLDLSNFNTTKVTSMASMFNNCRGLTSLNVSSFDTKNVTNMGKMFYYCNGYTSLDLSGFNTINVTNMNAMFFCNSKLKTILVNKDWDTSNVIDSSEMFANDSKLVGGAETTYKNANPKDKTYARIDGGESLPGYFTKKGD